MIKKEYTLINVLKFFCAILVIAIHSIYGKTNSSQYKNIAHLKLKNKGPFIGPLIMFRS